jgi:small GTP-binding protein
MKKILQLSMEIALQIIFSQFDEKIGPFTQGFYPESVPEDTRSTVSSMTIDFFTNSRNITNAIAIMSFPQLDKKGLVKILEWDDPTRRGGKKEATLSILFEEKDDPILYKYKDDIEAQVNEFLIDFLPLVQKNEGTENLLDQLHTFHKEVQELLLKLDSQEKQITEDSKAFPQTQGHAINAFKTIIIGDPGVGKTSTVLQFTHKAFRRSYLPTVGASITQKSIFLHNAEFQMVLWDLAGQSKFQQLRTIYYHGAQCVIIVFDLTNHISFENVRNWYADVKSIFSNFNDLAVVLCGNKSDLQEDIQVSQEKASGLGSELNIAYLETSARNGKNIEQIFEYLINTLISKDIIKV